MACLGSSLYFRIIFRRRKKVGLTLTHPALVQLAVRILQAPVVYTEREAGTGNTLRIWPSFSQSSFFTLGWHLRLKD